MGLLLIILAVALGILKLAGVLSMSWWLVTLPVWGPLALMSFLGGLDYAVNGKK